uniref:U24-Sparatoxin-Hju1am_1 n=1 Tax=Heteropoda jugulans TaxID=1358901 RepID=A0A4Q8KBQ1_9ARAC
MKIAVVMTLLLVAFSAVALAEESVERAALDLVIARGDCGWLFNSCVKHSECCEGWVCHKKSLQIRDTVVKDFC